MWGEKAIFFPETHVYRKQKTKEKNPLEKVRKHVFYKNTNIARKKDGKKSPGKSAKTRFL